MATVRLGFSPAPAHVRTARLVAVAVARRAGVAEGLLDEVRLAVGEACSRAVALHRRHGCADLVEVEMDDAAVVSDVPRPAAGAANRTAAVGGADSHPAAHRPGMVAEAAHDTDGPRFVVRVVDRAPPEARSGVALTDPMSLVDVGPPGAPDATGAQARAEAAQYADEAVAAGVGLALLAGLVDDLEVGPTPDGTATEVRMSWPIEPPR